MFLASTLRVVLAFGLLGGALFVGGAAAQESAASGGVDGPSAEADNAPPEPVTPVDAAGAAAGTKAGSIEARAPDAATAASEPGAPGELVEEGEDGAVLSESAAGEPKTKTEALNAEILASDFGPKEHAIAERAEGRWRALAQRDFAAAYRFTLPSYRQTHSEEQYRKRYGNAVTWRVAKVYGIRYTSPRVAKVRLGLEAELVPTSGEGAEKVVMRIDETWLEREGAWFVSLQ